MEKGFVVVVVVIVIVVAADYAFGAELRIWFSQRRFQGRG